MRRPLLADGREGLLRMLGDAIHQEHPGALAGEEHGDGLARVPIPGPLDPAPVTIATFPSSLGCRSGIMFSFRCAPLICLACAPSPAERRAG